MYPSALLFSRAGGVIFLTPKRGTVLCPLRKGWVCAGCACCPRLSPRDGGEGNPCAQFIAICSSAKTCEIGENLLSVSDPISRLQERLIHVGALIRPPTLQRRRVSGLHSYAAVDRSSTPMSPVPEPGRRPVGEVPLPPRVQTLLVSRLQACCKHYGRLLPFSPFVFHDFMLLTWQGQGRVEIFRQGLDEALATLRQVVRASSKAPTA